MPKLTMEYIESLVAGEHYFNMGEVARNEGQPTHASLDKLTLCVLILKNGFTVTGESAPVNGADYDATIGMALARNDAVDKIWTLEGYVARTALTVATTPSEA